MEDAQLLRYSRQIMLPEVDAEGQGRLLGASALIVGLGGLGSPAAMYLAAAGVGRLVVSDFDTVDLSNLQRQIAFDTADIGRGKAEACTARLRRMNQDVRIEPVSERLSESALEEWAGAVDVVLDCSDNFATRFAVNAACVATRTPLVSGAAIRFEGQLAVFTPGDGENPCYNCLYPQGGELDAGCARNGVVAALPGVIGSMQALEAIKLLLGLPTVRGNRLVVFDALRLEWHEVRLARNPACPTCGHR
ncbi:MAG: molybdopterin-synthase adenylyltransferase MoeB [Pseudomonadota bacterium]|jgi:adenylyltransferase/sulfurtransferase